MDTPNRPKPKVKDMIMQLSSMADLIGLRTYIIQHTPKGKSREPDSWAHTRAYMQSYANPANTELLIEALRGSGCYSDVEAVRWLLKYDELVP